jgi:DNA-binding MarR family transcriptional regulator
MTLEKEIKQTKPFSSKKEQALVNIIYTSNWIYFLQNKYLKNFDVSIQQYNVLRILNGQKGSPITINEIIDRMLDKMSNASRLVDKLLLKGYVIRSQKATNRRACDVIISPKGIEFLDVLNNRMKEMEDEMGDLSDKEFADFNMILDKLRKSAMQS